MKDIDAYVSRYVLPATTEVKNLTFPLLHCYGIDTFLAYRFDQDGNYSLLTNNALNTEFWHEQKFYRSNAFCSTPHLFSQGKILISSIDDQILQHEKNRMKKTTNMDHECLVLRKPSADTVLGFSFSTSLPNNKLIKLFRYTPHVFDRFIDYFLEASKAIRNKNNENAVSILPYRGQAFYKGAKYLEELSELNELNKRFLNTLKHNALLLTPTEKKCIGFYLDGCTAAESALQLKRSRRTIEAHFENIRQKLGIRSKRQLVHLSKTGRI